MNGEGFAYFRWRTHVPMALLRRMVGDIHHHMDADERDRTFKAMWMALQSPIPYVRNWAMSMLKD